MATLSVDIAQSYMETLRSYGLEFNIRQTNNLTNRIINRLENRGHTPEQVADWLMSRVAVKQQLRKLVRQGQLPEFDLDGSGRLNRAELQNAMTILAETAVEEAPIEGSTPPPDPSITTLTLTEIPTQRTTTLMWDEVDADQAIGFMQNVLRLNLNQLDWINEDGELIVNIENIAINDTSRGSEVNIGFADGGTYWLSVDTPLALYANILLSEEGGLWQDTEVTQTGIVLTPTENNGGAFENGITSDADNLIIAGRPELLHGAYIDGGGGYNTLEVDMKGFFAQPFQLLNIQEVIVQNLPNVYHYDQTIFGDTNNDVENGYFANFPIPNFESLALDGNNILLGSNSILDLSRASSLEKLVITEGDFPLYDSEGDPIAGGDLYIVGVRNNALLRFEGGFDNDVTVHYGEGMTEGAVNVELMVGDVKADINILHNASVLNVDSQGTENHLDSFFGGGSLSYLNISGEAIFSVNDDMYDGFNPGRPAHIDASANTGGVDLTLNNFSDAIFFTGTAESKDEFTANNNGKSVTINGGNGDNEFTATGGETVVINTGNGNNTIITDDSDNVTITSGAGDDIISSVRGDSVTVNAGDGNNEITVSADVIDIAAGAGNDTIVVSGMGTTPIGNADVIPAATAVLNIDTGTGEDTVVLGRDVFGGGFFNQFFGITALQGSSITGENITVYVENPSDLRAAELSGIQEVILNHDVSESINADVDNYGVAPILTLTSEQFAAIGGGNFSVEGSPFSTYSQVKVIVTESTSLTDLGVDDLPSGVDLVLEIQDGVTLSMTAEQLHTKVAPQGVTLANDHNTDFQVGSVIITGAGLDFDPFNTNDQARTEIDGITYFGGSLSSDFYNDANQNGIIERSEWGSNVLIDRLMTGYDRPADVPSYSRLVIDTDVTSEIGPFQTIETFLRIVGDSGLTFTPVEDGRDEWGRPVEGGSAIELGIDTAPNPDAFNEFIIDFSSVGGEVVNLTFARFEDALEIYGNGTSATPARLNVELTGDVASSDHGLFSRDVQTYVVTDLNGEDREFWTSRVTQNLETLGLRGNYHETITFGNTERGVNFLLEVEYNKFDGYSVGTLVADFARDGASTVIDVVNLDAPMPAGEVQKVAGIDVSDGLVATSINVEGGNTVIESFEASDALVELNLSADANLEMAQTLPTGLTSLDASGVVGTLIAEIDLWQEGANGPLTFVGAAGATELTLDDALQGAITSIEGAGPVNLTIGNGTGSDSVDLTETTLTNIGTVTLNENSTLSITVDQAEIIGAASFVYEGLEDAATLNLVGLNDQVFAVANYPEGLMVTLTLAELPEVILNPLTDLTGIGGLVIPEGTTLFLTMEQFQQLDGDGMLTGEGSVVITNVMQEFVGENGEDLNLDGIDLTGDDSTVTLNLGESVNLSDADLQNVGASVDTFNIGEFTLTLGDINDADGVAVIGDAGSVLKFIDISEPILSQIDASGFDVDTMIVEAALVADNNVDYMFDGLPERVTKVIVDEFGQVVGRIQNVVIQETVTVPGDLSFNDYGLDTEVSTLNLTLQGGALLGGDLIVSTVTPDSDLVARYLQELNIVSEGTAANIVTGKTDNIIAGDITPLAFPLAIGAGSRDNNLKLVNIDATQNLIIEGDIIFNSHGDFDANPPLDGIIANDDNNATVTLNISGSADVTVQQLDISDADIASLVINNNGGTLTVTGASPAIVTTGVPGETQTLVLTGTGDMVFGDNDELTTNVGIDSTSLVSIDATGLEGDLNLGEVAGVNSAAFDFQSGTGVTLVNLTGGTLNSLGADSTAGTDDDTAGWSFDFTGAAAGSQLRIDNGTALNYTAGSKLSINMGANGELFIDGDIGSTVDLSGLDLDISSVQDIILADGVELILTADQANGLNIVAGPDRGAAGITAIVNIVELGDEPVDLSGIAADIAGTTTLEDDDVTLDAATDLGDFSITLIDPISSDPIAGQTIRLATFEQADGREIIVTGSTTFENTNVVWLFDSLPAGAKVNTDDYSSEIGRLWMSEDLVTGQNVEELFTNLHSDIIIRIVNTEALSGVLVTTGFDRTVEIESLTTLGDLTFNDIDEVGEPFDFVENLSITLGGGVVLGNVEVDNILAAPIDNDDEFGTLTIRSNTAADENYYLLPELADGQEWNTGSGGVPLPGATNTIGNLSSGSATFDLNTVVIETAALTGFPMVFNAATAALVGGTVFFSDDDAGTTALLDVNGPSDVTFKALDTSDPNITVLTVDTAGHSGVYLLTGGSPAAAVGNTEVLNIDQGDTGEVWFGHVKVGNEYVLNTDGNGDPYAGVAGADLSEINVSGTAPVNLGVIALIDGSDDDTDDDGIPDQDAFTLNGNDVTTAILGEANVNGVLVAPTLDAESTWAFNDVTLTMTGDVTVGADSNLVFDNVALTVEGDLDLTEANLTFIDTTVHVPEGQSLHLTLDQIAGLGTTLITGEGSVVVEGEVDTDAAVTLDLSNIQTVGIDLSGITNVGVIVPQANVVGITLNAAGALNDADPAVATGFNVVGTDFNDDITGSNLDDTIDGGAGDDTLTGGDGSDTFLVTAGVDTISDLHADDPNADPLADPFEADVLIVSNGATANADGITSFFATAETVNNGIANLTTDIAGGVIDMTLAANGNGFNLFGSDGVDTLIGSANADVLMGGDGQDTLTGNGGADIFRFISHTSEPEEMVVETTTPGEDWERIEVTAAATADGTITIPYSTNNGGTFANLSVAVTNGMTADQVALAIRNAFVVEGFTAVLDGASDVEVRGAVGTSLELGVFDADGTGVTANLIDASTNTDVAQVTEVEIGTNGANEVVIGEVYSLTFTLAGGDTTFTVNHTATTTSEADVASGLETLINALGGAVTAGSVDNVLTITDGNVDNGGFTVVTSSTGGFDGSTAGDVNDVDTLDIIIDFTSGSGDKVDFQGLDAATGTNYLEAGEVANYVDARTAADTALNGTIRYYLTSVADDSGDAAEGHGVLFFDADGNGTADGAVLLVGVTQDNFAFTDIVNTPAV